MTAMVADVDLGFIEELAPGYEQSFRVAIVAGDYELWGPYHVSHLPKWVGDEVTPSEPTTFIPDREARFDGWVVSSQGKEITRGMIPTVQCAPGDRLTLTLTLRGVREARRET